ncbi:MAG: hypothetical protein NTV51_14310 [Verrucomicrobia bacterium]|nr:hypothetical protein [Verrucomicrobiota bacterium]
MNTKLTIAAAVTRTVTDRVIFEVFSNGVLELWDATRQNKISFIALVEGRPQTATFELYSAFHCGTAVIQQSDWQVECRGSSEITLGSVDFPYLNGAVYKLYPQAQRATKIVVTFEKTATGAAINSMVETSDGGKSTQRCEVMPNTAYSVVIAAFTERSVVSEPGHKPGTTQQRIISMPGGGTLTLTPAMPDVKDPIELGEEA